MSRRKSQWMAIVGVAIVCSLGLGGPGAQAQFYEVVATIDAGELTQGVDVNPVTNRIYVAAQGDDSLSVIDGNTNTVITMIPATTGTTTLAAGVEVDTANNRIYVSDPHGAGVGVFDGVTNTNIGGIGTAPTVSDLELNPQTTGRLYAAQPLANSVAVIDTTTNTNLVDIPVGNNPVGVAVNINTNTIYVTNQDDNTVSVINGNTNAVTDTIAVGGQPGRLDYNPVTNRLYVPTREDGVYVLDGTTHAVLTTIPLVGEPVAAAVDASRNLLYVANQASPLVFFGDSGSVSVVDGATNQVIDTVPVGPEPFDLAVNPVTNLVYVTHQGEDTLSVIGPANVNDLLNLSALDTAFSPVPCGGASAGTFTITATFTNISSDTLANLLISVDTLTGGNVLCNADGGPGGEGAIHTVPYAGDLAEGQLSPGESFVVELPIGLQSFNPFTFFVDVLGEVAICPSLGLRDGDTVWNDSYATLSCTNEFSKGFDLVPESRATTLNSSVATVESLSVSGNFWCCGGPFRGGVL